MTCSQKPKTLLIMLQLPARCFRGLRSLRSHHRPLSKIPHYQRPNFTVRPITIAHAHTQPASRPTNKHVSVNAEGIELIDLEFVEEPLGITAEQGHGYLRIEFGDALGPDNRYRIIRKLGWGMNSSIWMAFDEQYV